MPTAREARDSEKILSNIWARFPHLQVCVWYPISSDAIEHAESMIADLQKLINQLKEENKHGR